MFSNASKLAKQVLERCDELAACSEDPDCITRRFLTAPMRDVHDRVASWMRQAGMDPRIDNVGNIIGRRQVAEEKRVLILGSHLDSVPDAGRYDGVLGVLIGLAVAELLRERELPFNLDVIGFSEEEGERFGMPYLGSSAAAGCFRQEWLDRVDSTGMTLHESIAAYQLDPDCIDIAQYATDDVIGYMEPHLEQGTVLDRATTPVGVVSGIAGQARLLLEFAGKCGHAGTTSMHDRSDALVMAARFIAQVREVGAQIEGLRATVGRMHVQPNAPNVIPGSVKLSLDVRHLDDALREQTVEELLQLGRQIAHDEGGDLAVREESAESAVASNERLSTLLADAISDCGHEPLRLVSGAGHDAVVMGQKFPMAMLFLRHPGGISHHPDERVEPDDVATAIEVLAKFVAMLAEQYQINHVSSDRT